MDAGSFECRGDGGISVGVEVREPQAKDLSDFK